MSAAMILLYGVVAKAGIDLLQLGLIGWGLRRWGQDTDKRRKQNERWRAEGAERAAERAAEGAERAAGWAAERAETSQMLKDTSRGLADTHRILSEALAASQARRAGAGIC